MATVDCCVWGVATVNRPSLGRGYCILLCLGRATVTDYVWGVATVDCCVWGVATVDC